MKKLSLELNNYLKNNAQVSALLKFYNIKHNYFSNTGTLTFSVSDSFKEQIIKYPEVSLTSFCEYIIDDEHNLLEGMYHIIFDHREVINDDIFSLINSILLTMDLNLVCLELGDDQFYLTIAPIQAVKNLGMEFLNAVRYGDQKYGFEFKTNETSSSINLKALDPFNPEFSQVESDKIINNITFDVQLDIHNGKEINKKEIDKTNFIKEFNNLLEKYELGNSSKNGAEEFKKRMLEYRDDNGLDSELHFNYIHAYELYKAMIAISEVQDMAFYEIAESVNHIIAAEI